MTNQEKWERLSRKLDEIDAYGRCLGKVSFDQSCCAPEEGIEQAGEDMALLGKRLHQMTHAKSYVQLIRELHEDGEGLSPAQRQAVAYLYEDWERSKNQSPRFAYEMDRAFTLAYGAWLEAKKAKDFARYRDAFASVVDYTRRAVALRDRSYPSVYDACLDDNERGMNTQRLDGFFQALKERIVPLLRRIREEGKPLRTDFLSRPVSIPKQEAFSRYLLELEGLRKSALVLMTTEHPFTTNFGPHDVRVTTHYYEENFVANIFTTLHEGGHALFMQNEPEELHRAHCADRMSTGMHECVSRFYENLIGRSEAFIRFIYPKFRELGGETFADVSERELYEAVNAVSPGLIRTEADELSYSLHILIRYELEKLFVNGEITVDEVPERWRSLYKEYLGVDVPDDAQGCLQDVHWTMSFGYFPSYALGNAYGAQILQSMRKDFDVDAAVAEGRLDRIGEWLTRRVFSIASVSTPEQWLVAVTGEGLNPVCFLDYLEEKFTKLYGLQG